MAKQAKKTTAKKTATKKTAAKKTSAAKPKPKPKSKATNAATRRPDNNMPPFKPMIIAMTDELLRLTEDLGMYAANLRALDRAKPTNPRGKKSSATWTPSWPDAKTAA